MKWLSLIVLMILTAACGDKNSVSTPPAPDTSGSNVTVSSSETITVSGTVQYEDIPYDSNGLSTLTKFQAARRVLIDLVDQNNQIIASTSSDDRGRYSLSGSGDGLYLRILAQSGVDALRAIAIHNFQGNVYAATQNLTSPDSNNDVNLDINITKDNSINGAFNMLDVFLSARDFIANMTTLSLPATLVYWVDGIKTYGTYFCMVDSNSTASACPQGTGIYVTGGNGSSGDKDQYDDDVLWHEFSHFLESNLGISDSPGGPHSMTQNDLDLRLAWSEGWGNFFPTAVKNWLSSTNPGILSAPTTDLTNYVDTVGSLSNNLAGITIDLHSPGVCSGGECFVFSSNEIAVANIMSHLQHEYGIGPLWSVYEDYLSNLNNRVVNLESFWDSWLAQQLPDNNQLISVEAIFANRKVRYIPDTFEGDDVSNASRLFTACSTPTCPGEQHYFYSDILNDDIDVVGFNATAGVVYTIETFDLYNGADTEIFVQDGSGIPVLDGSGIAFSNDDRSTSTCNPVINDKLTYSSTLQFTAPSNGIYYVKVITSGMVCAGSGRYGSYSLRITVN